MPDPKFNGGSPVSDPNNIYSDGASRDQRNQALGSLTLPVEEHGNAALADLDAYGSSPPPGDEAVQRPLDPPTTEGGNRAQG